MENVSFIGDTLGPLFLFEPFSRSVSEIYKALSELDVKAAAEEWPLVEKGVAERALALMQCGILEDSDDALLWEYRKLFVGPARKAAPPWGSVYLDREQVIFGESTLALRQWMREHGIVSQAAKGDPDDHIGLMLLLMSWVANNEPWLLPEFLEKHLLTWSQRFLDVVTIESENPFFVGLSQLTKESLTGIERMINIHHTRG